MTDVTSDRMPPIAAERMTSAQTQVAEEIASGRRGELGGPFIPALRSPEFTRRLQRLGEYLRFENALEPRLREMVILLTAREWMQQYEWYIHAPIALGAGLSPAIVDAIALGERPAGMAFDEAIIYDFFVGLQRDKAVGDDTYNRAVAAFQEQGVVDLVGAVGYYTTLAMLMNVARTPLPDGAAGALEPIPPGRHSVPPTPRPQSPG